ncbi:hormone-sensitive lipase [Curvularia clavata]|uniref:Hormone-sensitive lipase n=1 Tax=Curvularia clavata TaxID=95742 RepID=A0A9Q8ZDZ8_CURCL|nr:hormone-sensitive lipase [Curvularia clavata]
MRVQPVSPQSPIDDAKPSHNLRKSSRIQETRSTLMIDSATELNHKEESMLAGASSVRSTRRRPSSLVEISEGEESASPTDEKPPASATSTIAASPDFAGHVCLCQPEPKIPRPRNAFILYRQHHQHAIIARNPGLNNPDISKIIGEQWQAESEEQKKVWQDLAQEEKARHHEQYPEYRYQPRRLGKSLPSPLNPISQQANAGYRCHKCGGRSIKPPTSPFLDPSGIPILPPPNIPEGFSPTTRYMPMMSNLNLESPVHPPGHGPPSLSNQKLIINAVARDDAMIRSPLTPGKKRRFDYGPVHMANSVRPDGPYYPRTQYARRDSLPPIQVRHSPPGSATMPPPRTPRDPRLWAAESASSSHGSSPRSVEEVLSAISHVTKIALLGRIAPPYKEIGSVTLSGKEGRGTIIAVEGDDLAAVKELAEWLNDQLVKQGECKPQIAEPPRLPNDDRDATFDDYLDLIKEWHNKSKEMIKYITTNSSMVASPSHDVTMSDKDSSTSTVSRKDSATPPDSPTGVARPVVILPTFQLQASVAYASQIPIQDAYSPMDHWQWLATLWRGTVGPDLTLYVKTYDANEGQVGQKPEMDEPHRLFTVWKEKEGRFTEPDLRRVGFEGTSRGDRHGPPLLRRISALLTKKLTVWQTVLVTLLYLYVARNFGKLVGLECPEPLASLYSRSYFRATWVTTALDAGFWSAMRIKRKGLRDLLSIVFSVYYMICAEQADEKVRKIRATLTVDHLRVAWNKGTSPYLGALTSLMRPRLMVYPPRKIRIPRPRASSYKEPVTAWLYFNGPRSALKKHDKIVLDIPGGGFVAMDPRNHDDKLMGWAGKTGLPVLSLDYKKAPEHPYPYALNECYDVYHMIMASRGTCMGLSGEVEPKIVVSGDSAGGNLAVGMVLMILQSGSTETRRWQGERTIPPPVGVVLIYPALDMNIGNWMTDEQMALIRDRRVRKTNRPILRHKSDDYRHLAPNTPYGSDSDSDDDTNKPNMAAGQTASNRVLKSAQTMIRLSAAHTGQDSQSLPRLDTSNTTINGNTANYQTPGQMTPANVNSLPPTPLATQPPTPGATLPVAPPTTIKTRLTTSSMISYFNDRILTPEMMRAMIILYVGPHHRPDFSTDFLLSPLLAPESLLAKFPRCWMLTGERDPLVDDTVIFAGRLRQAKRAEWIAAKDLGLDWARGEFHEENWVNVDLIPGISHGFLQFASVFPEGWKYIYRCGKWITEAFDADADKGELETPMYTPLAPNGRPRERGSDYFSTVGLADAIDGLTSPQRVRHHRRTDTMSSADEDRPLEMTVLSKGKRSPQDNQNGGARDANARGRGRVRRSDRGRRKSLVSLASEDDLLGRRMKGLTGGLGGGGVV